jgi:hypothetical protein
VLAAALATALTLAVPASGGTPGYEVEVATEQLALTTRRDERTLLATESLRLRRREPTRPVEDVDVTDPAAGGYVMLTMSRDYAVELMWDSDGNGRLDGWKGGGASQRPVWLRLDRSGDAFSGLTSGDGETWAELGTVEVPSADGPQDAGVALSAVNLFHPGERASAVFDRLRQP